MSERNRRLLLLRHAVAEQTSGIDDASRRLTDRGRRDAMEVGRWLADRQITCDIVFCSSSMRTQDTWAAATDGGATADVVQVRRELYDDGTRGVLEVLHTEAADAGTVLVVGHAPTMPALAMMLTDSAGSTTAQAALAQGYPTSALAVLRYAGDWLALAPGTCALDDFYIGRG